MAVLQGISSEDQALVGREPSLDEIKKLTNLETIKGLLKELNQHEQRVDQELDVMLTSNGDVEQSMTSLLHLNPELQGLHTDAQQLGSTVSYACELAENVSSKVRQLDVAQTNVQQTLRKVEDIIALQNTVEGLEDAMARKDYGEAANHAHRYLSFDPGLLDEQRQWHYVGEGDPGSTKRRLAKATEQLLAVVNRSMDEAIRKNSADDIIRYFKLFPLVGAPATGLRKYIHYVVGNLGGSAHDRYRESLKEAGTDSSQVNFVRLVTVLFECVVKCSQQETLVIEPHCGAVGCLSLLQALSRECDRQTSTLLDAFYNERAIHKLVNDINYAYSKKPSQRDILGATGTWDGPAGPDPRDLDSVLWELATLINRAELYDRFMRRQAAVAQQTVLASLGEGKESKQEQSKNGTGQPLSKRQSTTVASTMSKTDADEAVLGAAKVDREKAALREMYNSEVGPELLATHTTTVSNRAQEIVGHYVLMEEYFLQICQAKAVHLNKHEPGQHVSTMVEDIFFVTQKCARRAMSSNSVDCVCAVLNHVNSSIGGDLGLVLKKNLSIGVTDTFANLFSGTGDIKDVLGQVQKKMDLSSTARVQEYMVHLNNLETSAQYVAKLQTTLTAEFESLFAHLTEKAWQKGMSCLADLGGTAATFNQMLEEALEKTCNYALHPQLHSYCEQMAHVSYVLTDEELSYQNANDPFMHGLIDLLEALIQPFKEGLTEGNFEEMTKILTWHLTSMLETLVLDKVYNQNGGLQLEKDIRALVAYLTTLTKWTVRDRFNRLRHIATLLSLESVEDIHQYWGGGSAMTWGLTPKEVRKILSTRVDLNKDSINRLQL